MPDQGTETNALDGASLGAPESATTPSAVPTGELSPFDYALAGVTRPMADADFAVGLVQLMRTMRNEQPEVAIVDQRLERYVTYRPIIPDPAQRQARQPIQGGFVDISPPPEPAMPDERFRLDPAPVPVERRAASEVEESPTAELPAIAFDALTTSRFPAGDPVPPSQPAPTPELWEQRPFVERPGPAVRVSGTARHVRRRPGWRSVAVLGPLASALVAAALVGGFLWWQSRSEEGSSVDAGLGADDLAAAVSTADPSQTASPSASSQDPSAAVSPSGAETVTSTGPALSSDDDVDRFTAEVRPAVTSAPSDTGLDDTSTSTVSSPAPDSSGASSTTERSASSTTAPPSTTAAPTSTTTPATTAAPTTAPPTTARTAVVAGALLYERDVPSNDIVVNLYADNDGNGVKGRWLTSTNTSARGIYSFTVEPGCYVIGFNAPQGYQVDRATQNRAFCADAGDTFTVDGRLLEN